MNRLRVMSWNVGRIYSPTGNNRLADGHVARVARTIRELLPDVVLLQELASTRQLHDLLDRLSEYSGAIAEDCRYDRHVATLARTSLRASFEQHCLEPTGRGLVAVTFDTEDGRGAAFSVHLDVHAPERKRTQVEAILALATPRPESFVVVGGDFNFDPIWAPRLRMHVDVATFALFDDGFEDTGRDGGPTLLGLLRVDHLLVRRPALRRLSMHVPRRRRLPLGDHAPIVLDAQR
jgi:endonuclease/exonuclease/phosphatase family metal-dependent hydrolase